MWCVMFPNLLLLLLLVRTHAVSFPEDTAPLDIVDRHYSRQYPVFRGRPSGNESQHRLDFQLMTRIQDTLFIAGRDQVYLVSLRESYRNDITPYRKLTWRSSQADRETCALKGKHRDECHNFIKVLVPRNDDLVFICGTNGFNPMCRYYRLDNLEFDGEEISGLARCPFDAKQTNVALFSDGKLYSATVADFLASDAVIYRSMGDGSALRTIKYDSKWLKEPHFLHAVDYGNYVYFFFREIAAEHNNLGRAVYSRVARVCKNDVGGSQRVLEKHWTSFVKARLNCSVPGESFFYFDVLQSLTDIINISGVPSVVGVFTTQLNSIPGSAVCAFSMPDIEKVFEGRFKEQKTPDSVWTPVPDDRLPRPRPGCCAGHGSAESYKSSVEFPDETLQFIKLHPLMDAAVPSIRDEPWVTKTRVRYRLTALAVDNAAGPYKNYTVVFIGSEAGVVLKVLAKTAVFSLNESVLLEEIDVFNQAKCLSNSEDDRRVLSFHLDRDTHTLYVAFSSCVVRIPLSRCERHRTCHKSCIASRDPYCGWMSHGACERIPAGVDSGFEQDVEFGDTGRLGDCHAEQEKPALSVTPSSASEPKHSPHTPPSLPPQLLDTRRSVLRDDSETSRSFESVMEGIWEIQSADSNQLVHMNILITCVFAAFLLGAFIAGAVVYCYRDVFLHKKTRKIHKAAHSKDEESAPSRTDSTGSFTKLNGLFESPVKEFPSAMEEARIYFSGDKDEKNPESKTIILSRQNPELAALPTPESTPVLHQKGLQPNKSQWEKAQGKTCVSRKEAPPKSPQNPSIPSAVVLPNATHEKTVPSSDTGSVKSVHKERRRSVDARNTLNELLKHLNEANEAETINANPKAIMADTPRPRPHLMLEPMGNLAEIPPKVPSREASLYSPTSYSPPSSYSASSYSPSSSLPRHSPTKRVDVPSVPTSPTGQMGTLDRQRFQRVGSAHRHAGSSGAVVVRHSSFNRGALAPPTPPSRMDSQGISRQHSYSGYGSLPRTSVKRTASLKPDVPPKPGGFVPQTRPVNKYSY
ncbi:sema domain, transmembrane domain (TM), and cytoplasmic domain, (semaphorin) 6D, like isoform X4 [Pangasianodon hypophthalmus]|uniref:sema domain, transmembrane domain (TM), and cytoplasmic domain, (semaphorin) 6D, like isoform X4 n=1 Tax=Pangasianodon hypophthalmus TaxID=310915 RepID=UPI0023077529|nr:sema domain, transmembrane domain (TM), and cytoplasmic domain, (semaphorin) 6D, like isoform X4 [Pangasianodon hypophthalmus]